MMARQAALRDLDEPFRSRFVALVRQGAAAADMAGERHAGRASDAFVQRELDRPRQHARSICRYIRHLNPRRILDVGCGTGALTIALAGTFPEARVIGMDINPLTLDAGRVRVAGTGLPATFVLTGQGPFPFRDGAFDLITCSSVIEFVTDAGARREFAREIVRLANGHVLVTTPNPFHGVRERHSGRWLGDFRRADGSPWASTRRELDRLFAPCAPVPVPGRVGDKLGVATPCWLSGLIEPLLPWQFRIYRRPLSA